MKNFVVLVLLSFVVGCRPATVVEPRPISKLNYLELSLLLEAEGRKLDRIETADDRDDTADDEIYVRARKNYDMIRDARDAAWERDKPK